MNKDGFSENVKCAADSPRGVEKGAGALKSVAAIHGGERNLFRQRRAGVVAYCLAGAGCGQDFLRSSTRRRLSFATPIAQRGRPRIAELISTGSRASSPPSTAVGTGGSLPSEGRGAGQRRWSGEEWMFPAPLPAGGWSAPAW